MKRFRFAGVLATLGAAVTAFAGLSEPSALFWGGVFIEGVAQRGSDDVLVRARVNRAPFDVFPGDEDWIVGQSKLGDSVAASSQSCGEGDCYLLNVRLESLPSDMSRTPGRAALGDQIHICIARGDEPEVCSERDRMAIYERGYAAKRNIGLAPATFDWNADGFVGSLDHANLAQCLIGPGMEASSRCQEVFDAINDGAVDLLSFAGLQNAFDPS